MALKGELGFWGQTSAALGSATRHCYSTALRVVTLQATREECDEPKFYPDFTSDNKFGLPLGQTNRGLIQVPRPSSICLKLTQTEATEAKSIVQSGLLGHQKKQNVLENFIYSS